jgi:hypothetical protein
LLNALVTRTKIVHEVEEAVAVEEVRTTTAEAIKTIMAVATTVVDTTAVGSATPGTTPALRYNAGYNNGDGQKQRWWVGNPRYHNNADYNNG